MTVGRQRGISVGVLVLALCVVASGCQSDGRNTFRILAEPQSSGDAFWSALYQTTAAVRTKGNRIEVVNNGRVFDVMEEAIRGAKQSVNVVLFIWRPGEPGDHLAQVLADKARAGIACRVLIDPIGSKDFEDKVKPVLEAGGCQTKVFRPIPADENLARNHRKIVVVDGRVGITGGFGIYKSWLGDGRANKETWRDTNVRVEGPVVAQLQQAFAENWQEASGQLLPLEDFPRLDEDDLQPASAGQAPRPSAAFVASTASPEVTRAERLTQLIVQAAHKRLWIAQAYFTPNSVLKDQLIAKAKDGVQVWVLAPGDVNDQPEIKLLQRASYEDLLKAGVRIWEYQPSMMHSKVMIADDAISVVGSINYDPLSFNKLEEGSLVAEDRVLAQKLSNDFREDLKFAVEVSSEQ